MVIKVSSRKQIDALIRDLASDRAVTRDAAVARLAVIGTRAVVRLAAASRNPLSSGEARAAALRALEAIDDPHSVDAALAAIDDTDPVVACAAINVARAFLRGRRSVALVDDLARVALDGTKSSAVRVAATEALQTLPAATIAPLRARLQADPDSRVATTATGRHKQAAGGLRLPDDPAPLRHTIARAGATLSLSALHQLIERIREQEGSETGVRRNEWMAARGAAHAALAARGSRLGVYDLREALEKATQPLPVEMLTALAQIGDASCLEPIAGAFLRVPDQWWRSHVVDAFRAIIGRERIVRRHPEVVKTAKRYPEAFLELWGRAARRPVT